MSLRARLVVAFTYVLVLVIVALEVPLALNLSKRVDAEIKSEARGQAQLVATGASGQMNEPLALKRLVEESEQTLGGRVLVVDARGRVLADSAGPGTRGQRYGTREEIRTALSGRPTQGERHSDLLDEDLLFTAVPIASRGRTIGAVRVTESVDAVNDEQRNDVIALIGVGVVALLLGLVVAWLLAGSLANPLRGLARAARRVAGGDLDARAKVEGSAEQREVATAFNDMTGQMATTLRGQREFVANASHQLRTPLTGLRLRLEAASLKSRDPEVERELAAAEHETERLARLLSELLTLAGGGERPAAQPLDVSEVVDAACRALAGTGRAVGARAGRGAGAAGGGGGLGRGPRRDPRQPHGERAELLAARHRRDAHLGARRRHACGSRCSTRARASTPTRASACSSASTAGRRAERRRGHGARAGGGGVAGRALGRRGDAGEPARGRRPRRGGPPGRAGFAKT